MLANALLLIGDYTEDYTFFPVDASSFAETNDWLFKWISWVAVAFFIPIVLALFGFALKYRKPKGSKAESEVAHNTPLELAWSIFPSFFLVGMFVLGAQAYLKLRWVPDGAREIRVDSRKWSWGFNYGNGVVLPELHLAKDEPVKLSMRSDDVIHSLFIPAFRAKKDVVPGRFNYMWFQPTRASEKVSDEERDAAIEETKGLGESWSYDDRQFTQDGYRFYDLYCAEYCGQDHSEMQAVVVVHETVDELEAWIKENSKRKDGVPPAEYGKKLYDERGCKSCHSTEDTRLVGPPFKGLYGRSEPMTTGDPVLVDANYIRESILEPKAKVVASYKPVMPSYKGQLSDDDIYCIIEWLKTLSEKPGTADSESESEEADPAP